MSLYDKQEEIDSLLRKAFPRKHGKKSLEKLLGKPKFAYDVQSINSAINSPFWDLLDRGGKRWRPKIFNLILRAYGKKDRNGMAAVVELIHNATLVHDDIEDSSETRRGKPCLHILYGTDVAINIGDALYYIPAKVILNAKIPEKTRNALLEVYLIEMIRITHGQGLDIWWHRNNIIPSEKQYLQMCAYKTGTLARLGAKMAAIIAGQENSAVERLGSFAESLGVGFQIQDDIINIVGDEKKYGKEIGGDITEGKKTLMVIRAMETLPKREASELGRILAAHTRERKRIRRAIYLIGKSGAVEYAKKRAAEIMGESWEEAERVLPEGAAKEELKSLALFLINREF